MRKSKPDKYNANIMQHAVKKQRYLQRTVGTNWWYERSKTSVVSTILCEIAFYCNLFIAAIMLTKCSIEIDKYSGNSETLTELSKVNNTMWSFIVATLLMVAAYVLKKVASHVVKNNAGITSRSLYLIAMLSAILGSGLSLITALRVRVLSAFTGIYSGVEVISDAATTSFKTYFVFITCHALPLLVFLVSMVLFFIMNNCDRKEKLSMYNSITEKLYKEFTGENPSFTDAQWEECMNSYTGEEEENGKKKRSKKARRKKEKQSREE